MPVRTLTCTDSTEGGSVANPKTRPTVEEYARLEKAFQQMKDELESFKKSSEDTVKQLQAEVDSLKKSAVTAQRKKVDK